MNRSMKIVGASIAATMLVGLLAACGSTDKGSVDQTKTIKAGVIENSLFWTAWTEAATELEENGDVDLKVVPFKSSADAFVALSSGDVDMAGMGINVVASGVESNADLPVSLLAGLSPGRSEVILRTDSGITDWNDIRGRNLGVVRGSTDELIFTIALAENGIDMQEDTKVTTVQSGTDLRLALKDGAIDAAVTSQPTTSMTVADGLAAMPEEMNTQLQEWASVPTFIAARDEIIDSDHEAVQKVMDKYVEVVGSFKDRQLWVDTNLEYTSGDPDQLLSVVKTADPWFRMEEGKVRSIGKKFNEFDYTSEDVSDALATRLDYEFISSASDQSAEDLGKAKED